MKEMMMTKNRTYSMVYTALFTVLIAICSWISIPTVVPFTLQTFAVFLAVGVLGGKRGTAAIIVYLLLGAVGIPVFAGFTSGLGILFGSTGGYLIGFVATALVMWGMEKMFGKKTWILALSMVLGLIVCYALGTAWFMFVYGQTTGAVGIGTVLAWCVLPFIIPDAVKIFLALLLSKRLAGVIRG